MRAAAMRSVCCLKVGPNLTLARRGHSVALEKQSRLLPGDEQIRVSCLLDNKNAIQTGFEQIGTIYELLRHMLDNYESKPCLGTRDKRSGKYEWFDFHRVYERSIYTGSALQEFGVKPDNSSFVGINCKNRPEFNFTYFGCSAFSNVFVPLYDNLDKVATTNIISSTEIPILICDSESKARFLIQGKVKFPKLRTVVTVDRPTRDLVNDGRSVGLQIVSFLDFEMAGKMRQKRPVPPKPDDLFTICWTSGTTGLPKGALITHRNLIESVAALKTCIHPAAVGQGSTISYMPTGHIYEIIIQLQTLGHGGSLGFFGGDVLKLMDDIKELRPRVVPMVPRLLNKLYVKALADIRSSPLKRRLLPTALKQKEKQLKRGIVSHRTLWDRLVFKSVREMFGNNIEVMTNSAAPLSPEVANFFRCALGCYIFDAYGQTEIGPLSLTLPHEFQGGHVGPPVPTAQVKLVDVPEMNYFVKDNVGEVCARGPTVFKGYFKNPSATKEAIDENGWLFTGDIGRWQPNGSLKIIDRRKNFFKLSQGEFIAPDKLENGYAQSPFVAQIFVDGLPDQNYLVAIVVPDPTAFPHWASRKGFNEKTLKELCANKELRKKALHHLRKLGTKNGMNSLELIRNVHLHPELMTIEAGFLTPTLKLKRNVVRKEFATVISELYKEGPLNRDQKS